MVKKSYLVGIDEYQREQLFMLGAVIATDSQASALERKWTQLRRKIKQQLIADKPRLEFHPKLAGDLLPEIHAVDLIQSTDYYRIGKPKNPKYWERQYRWLEEALAILRHYGVEFIFYPMSDYATFFKNDGHSLVKVIEQDTGIRLSQSTANEIVRRADHPYIRGFAQLIATIDVVMNNRDSIASIICDEYNDCREFSELDCYEMLRENDHLKRLDSPKFLSSTDETLIQAADVACYVFGKNYYELDQFNKNASHRFHHTHETFSNWYRKYILPRDLSVTREGKYKPISANPAVARLMLAEMTLLRAGGDPATREHLTRAFESVLKATFPK